MVVRFNPDREAITRQFLAGGQVFVWVSKTVGRITDLAKLLVPVRTGYLRNSITDTTRTGGPRLVIGRVGASAEYALAVHEGTRPHIIRAHGDGMLAFKGSGGRLVFRKQVMHPGTVGKPFLRRAAQTVLAETT